MIRSLSESFAIEEPEAIFGIVNGTCNYILSQMEKSGKPYAEALKEAQQKGYAETNPAADVNGSDAEAKLLLLSLVGFGLQLQPGTNLAQRDRRYSCGRFSLRRPHRQQHHQAARRGAAKRVGGAGLRFARLGTAERIFWRASTAQPTPSVSPARAAAPGAASAIATMFWSVRAPGAGRPRWQCSAMFASWRAASANSAGRRV